MLGRNRRYLQVGIVLPARMNYVPSAVIGVPGERFEPAFSDVPTRDSKPKGFAGVPDSCVRVEGDVYRDDVTRDEFVRAKVGLHWLKVG